MASNNDNNYNYYNKVLIIFLTVNAYTWAAALEEVWHMTPLGVLYTKVYN